MDHVWRRSTMCDGGACIELKAIGETIAVRDGKDPDGPIITYSRAAWRNFVTEAKQGGFDGSD